MKHHEKGMGKHMASTTPKKLLATLAAASSTAGLAVILASCEASPVQDTKFLPQPEMMKKYDMVPVQKMWRDPNLKASDYTKIIVMPVYTKDQLPYSSMETMNIRTWMDDQDQDVADFAHYMEVAFKKAILKSKRVKLVDKPGPNTMVLELNLVKVVPGKPVLGALGNLSNLTPIGFLLSPIKMGAGATTDSPMKSSVAIEGKIYDSLSKKMLVMFADREKQQTAFFNLNDFTAYGNAEQIADEWAKQFVECIDKRPIETGTKIEKDSNVGIISY